MQSYLVKLIEKKSVATDTIAFVFEKPKNFEYKAGQYASLILPQLANKGPRESIRSMSFASAPHEEFLLIAMRMGPSLFKRTLKEMKVGEQVEIRGPLGILFSHEGKIPAVYIAGGIGVAPFRGMILAIAKKKWPHAITLFYAIRTLADASFLSELQAIKNKNFKIIPIMTRDKNWQGEREHCNEKMIKKYVPDFKKAVYYIVGLPEMVTDVNIMLSEMDIEQENIKTELFTGY